MLVPRERRASITKSLGTERVETRKGQGEAEPSGPASEGDQWRERQRWPPDRRRKSPRCAATLQACTTSQLPNATSPLGASSVPTEVLSPIFQSLFAPRQRGARTRSVARDSHMKALVDETPDFCAEATDKEEVQIAPEAREHEATRNAPSRECWRKRAEEKTALPGQEG